jgi:integrase
VDALLPGEQLWDAEIAGFGVVANAHSKSYKLKYYHQGRQRMLTIGVHGSPLTVDQARRQALIYKGQQQSGQDPAATKKATGVGTTVEELCAEYLKKHAFPMKKEGSALMDQANIKNHVIPLLGHLAIADVSSTDVESFKHAVRDGKTAPQDPKAVQKLQRGGSPVKGGKGVANRCLALLSKMFNLAELWGVREKRSNPVFGVTKFKEKPKERFLSEEELRRLWAHLDKLEEDGAAGMQYPVALIRLLMLTGARCGEIQTLTWSMVDLQNKRLKLPDSKTGSKTIQLSDQAVKELRGLPKASGNPYVIVGAKDGKPLQNIRKPWIKIRKEVGLEDVRIHDLRHSFASLAAAQGVDLLTLGKLMGHRNASTTSRYAHLTEKHVSKANQSIGDALERAFAPQRSSPDEVDDAEKEHLLEEKIP